tara:strand:+ start:1358 stop:1861 length:504 start_codon:yes stop_codon:yes gene_type:complete
VSSLPTGFVRYAQQQSARRYKAAGAPEVTYYRLNRGKNVDPLYGEPLSPASVSPSGAPWNFDGPVKFCGVIEYTEYDDQDPEVQEALIVRGTAFLSFAIWAWQCAHMERGHYTGVIPKIGDVLGVHGEWWNVVKAGRIGPILNSGDYTDYKLDLRRNSKFTPDRKLT